MSKIALIENICEVSRGLSREFLEEFSEEELDLYLEHLLAVDLEELAACA